MVKFNKIFISLLVFTFFLLKAEFSAGESLDLSLSQSIERGLVVKKDLQFSAADLRFQSMAISEKIRNYFPKLSLQVENSTTIEYNAPDIRSNVLVFGLNQLLYDGGKLNNEIRQARASLYLASLDTVSKRTEAVFQIADAYLGILRQHEKIRMKRELLENSMKEMKVTEKQAELGEATALDLLEWQIQEGQLEIDLKQLESDLRDSMSQFKRLLTLDDQTEINLTQNLKLDSELPEAPVNTEDYYREALGASIDLKKLEMSLYQSKIGSFKNSLFIPEVGLTASYTADLKKFFSPDNSWSIGLSLTLPAFFDTISLSGGLGGNIKGTESSPNSSASTTVYNDPSAIRQLMSGDMSGEQIRFQYEEAQKDLKMSVEKTVRDLRFQREKSGLAEERVKLGEKKEIILKEQQRIGEIRLSEYIQYQNSVSAMKTDRLDAVYQYVSLQLKLYKLRGMLSENDLRVFYEEFLE